MNLSRKTGISLKRKGLTLSTAESCTGGLLSAMIIGEAGSSAYFRGGVVAYSNESKVKLLGVKKATLGKFGAVSREAAAEMARGAAGKFSSDMAVSVTGIAGPSGEAKGKPVGLVFFGLFRGGKVSATKKIFKGGRRKIQSAAAGYALSLLYKSI